MSRPQGLGAVTLHARLVREDRSDNEWTPGPPLSSAQRRDPATRRGGIREARADPGRPLLHGRALPSPTVSRAALPARPPSASQRLPGDRSSAPPLLSAGGSGVSGAGGPMSRGAERGLCLSPSRLPGQTATAEQQHLRPTVTEAGSSRPRRRRMQDPVRSSSWHVDGRLLAVSPRGGRQEEGALVSLLIRHRSHPGGAALRTSPPPRGPASCRRRPRFGLRRMLWG